MNLKVRLEISRLEKNTNLKDHLKHSVQSCWRTVVSITNGPSALAVKEAAWGLARYAALVKNNKVGRAMKAIMSWQDDINENGTYYLLQRSNSSCLEITTFIIKEGDEKVEGHVRYEYLKKTVKVFLTRTDKLDELKAQLNKYFEHVRSEETAKHIFVQAPYVDLAATEVWVYKYEIETHPDDAAVKNMFDWLVLNNKLHLCVRFVCRCQDCR